MNTRRLLTYGGIAVVSLAAGAYEAVIGIPGYLRPALLVGIPMVCGFAGAEDAFREGQKRTKGAMNEGFYHATESVMGFGGGLALSAICEGAGFGLVKLARHFS